MQFYFFIFFKKEDNNMSARQRAIQRNKRREQQSLAAYNKFSELFDFSKIFSVDSLRYSMSLCARGCSWKSKVIKFMFSKESSCLTLNSQLMSGKYKKKTSSKFIRMERGKKRIITAVRFEDRIVQRALCDNFLLPILKDSFIYDNAASMENKGTSFARERLKKNLIEAYNKYEEPYVVITDYHNYFGSIDSLKVYNMFEKRFKNILYNAKPYIPLNEFNDKMNNLKRILRILKIFITDEKGLGLGNQTSQLAALYYINRIDHNAGRFGSYGRYMDDTYCICKNREEAMKFYEYFKAESKIMELELNEHKTRIVPLKTSEIRFMKRKYYFDNKGNLIVKIVNKAKRNSYKHIKHVLAHSDGVNINIKELTALKLGFKNNLKECSSKEKFWKKCSKELDAIFLKYGFNLHSTDKNNDKKNSLPLKSVKNTENANDKSSEDNTKNDKRSSNNCGASTNVNTNPFSISQNDVWGTIPQQSPNNSEVINNVSNNNNIKVNNNTSQIKDNNKTDKEKEKQYRNIGKNSTFSDDGDNKWPLSRRAKKKLKKEWFEKNKKQIEARRRRRKYIKDNVLY